MTACKSGDHVIDDVKRDVWLHEALPAEACAQIPDLKNMGIYRKVKCQQKQKDSGTCDSKGQYEEFVSYCDPAIAKYLSMHQEQIKKWQAAIEKGCK